MKQHLTVSMFVLLLIFSLDTVAADYRVGLFEHLPEAVPIDGDDPSNITFTSDDRIYINLSSDEESYDVVKAAFNQKATIVFFNPETSSNNAIPMVPTQKPQNKLLKLTGVALNAPYVVFRSLGDQPEFSLADNIEELDTIINCTHNKESDFPTESTTSEVTPPLIVANSVNLLESSPASLTNTTSNPLYIPEKNFTIKLNRRNISCNLHSSRDFKGTMDYCQGNATIDVNVNVSMMRSVVAPKPDLSGNTRDIKLVRFSVDQSNTGGGIHLRDHLINENAWKQSNVHRHTRLGPFAHSYSMSVEPIDGIKPAIISELPGNENPEFNHQQQSTISIGVNSKLGAEVSAEGPKGSAEVGASFGLSMSRSLSWNTKEYRIRNSTNENHFSVTWERSLDECQLLLRREAGCYFTAGIAWGGKMWDENKIDPIAYSNFVPNIDVIYEVPPEENGSTKFLLTAATNIKAQFGYVGWDFLFGWYQPAGNSSLTQSTNAYVTVDWSHPIFEPEAHVKLRSLYADNLCLTNQHGHVVGKGCELNNRHQVWGLDTKERYKSRSGQDQCLGLTDKNELVVDQCNENLSQKWFWNHDRLISRKIDDQGKNLVLQLNAKNKDQIEVVSEPLSENIASSWRNELNALM